MRSQAPRGGSFRWARALKRWAFVPLFLCAALFAAYWATRRAPGLGSVRCASEETLVPGQTVVGEIRAGESRCYRLPLPAGNLAALALDQTRIDVEARLWDLGRSRRPRTSVDNLYETRWPEDIVVETLHDTTYLLVVKPFDEHGHGRFEIRWTAGPRPRQPGDEPWLAAWSTLVEARTRRLKDTSSQLDLLIDRLTASLPAWQARKDEHSRGEALLILAELLNKSRCWQEAERAAGEAQAIFARLDEPGVLAPALLAQASALRKTGRPKEARDVYLVALKAAERSKNWEAQATGLYELGTVELGLGDAVQAKERFASLLKPRWPGNQQPAELYARDGLGDLYNQLGYFAAAEQQAKRELELARDAREPDFAARAYQILAWAQRSRGDLVQARASLARAHDLFAPVGLDRERMAVVGTQAIVEADLGHFEVAERLARKSLDFAEEQKDRKTAAITRFNLGAMIVDAGRPAEGLALCEGTLGDFTGLGDRSLQASSRLCQAKALAKLDRLEAAVEQARQAVELIEALRDEVAAPELQAQYFASKQGYYETYIDLLMRLEERQRTGKQAELALEISERAHARWLLDGLAELRQGLRQQVDPDLAQRLEELETRIREVKRARDRQRTGEEDQAELELRDLLAEHDLVEGEIRRRSPRYAALAAPTLLRRSAIQSRLLSPDTDLLVYFLGDRASFLWRVTRNSLDGYPLAPRKELEQQAKTLADLLAHSDDPNQRAALDRAQEQLSQSLLGPLAGRELARKLLVVPDGGLHWVPFQVLLAPEGMTSASDGAPPWLLDRHEVTVVASASVAAALVDARRSRTAPRYLLSLVGDPVFRAEDHRLADVGPGSRTPVNHGPSTDRPRAPARGGPQSDLPLLPYVRDEVENILRLVPPASRQVLTGFAANRDAVLHGGLANSRWIHFATHGVVDERYPALSTLELSRFDAQGHPTDGVLQLQDVYSLELSADLVVLSACRTATGEELRGEGLVSLARGFFYAGASSLVVSLWNVGDAGTAELMQRFYRNLLDGHLPPGEAFQAAQRSMRLEPRWSAPVHWAGFSFQGLSP